MGGLSKLAGLTARFVETWEDWGPSAAYGLVLASRFQRGESSVKLHPSGARFSYRGYYDRAVLAQFGGSFGYIETSGGPPIRTIVDAGANIGVFSAQCRRIYPDASIAALEIEPDNARVLALNAKSLGSIEPLAEALWSKTGTVSFVRGDGPEAHSVAETGGEGQLRSTSIKDLMERLGWEHIDILKMDVEGAEQVIVQSLDDDTLGRINAIRFECNDHGAPGNTLGMMERLVGEDFDAFGFDENVYLIRRRIGWAFKRRYAGLTRMP